VIKLALAVTVPGVDVQRIVQTQRTATLRHVQDVTKLKRATSDEAGGRNELAWLLVLDNLVFGTEAEVRWLDHIETRLARYGTRPVQDGKPAAEARARDTASSPATDSTESASRPNKGASR
jgi:hypothetical protein